MTGSIVDRSFGELPFQEAVLPAPVAGEALPAARRYESNPRFHQAATSAAEQAAEEIRVTYPRRYPPDQYTTPASVRYFEAVTTRPRYCEDLRRPTA